MANIKLDRQQKTTANLPLKPIKDRDGEFLYEGFVPAILKEVTVIDREYEKGEFAGLTIPVLQFTFINYPLTKDEPERVLTHQEKPIGTVQYKGEDSVEREEADISNNVVEMWKRIKSFLDELSDSPNFRSVDSISDADYASILIFLQV